MTEFQVGLICSFLLGYLTLCFIIWLHRISSKAKKGQIKTWEDCFDEVVELVLMILLSPLLVIASPFALIVWLTKKAHEC